jgi:hypothetical protein
MIPFATGFQELIDYAEFILNSTQEGTLEGQVIPGSKPPLQSEIDLAKSILASQDLVQRLIDSETENLLNAIYTFDSNIAGNATIFMDNSSFEAPGFVTSNFDEVPGWATFGKLEEWAPPAEIHQGGSILLPLDSVPDGDFVAKIGSYTQGIYQRLMERIHPGVNYSLHFKASLLFNNPDAYGDTYPVIILSRLISFDKEIGDYRFVQVISESYDTIGIAPGGFAELDQSFDISAASGFIGRELAVDFMVRHTFNTGTSIWAESYVAIDEISMFRKQN